MSSDRIESVTDHLLYQWPQQYLSFHLVLLLDFDNPILGKWSTYTLMHQCGYTQEAAAQRLGKSRPALANLLRLLTLPAPVQEMVRQGQLSTGHAKVLAGLDGDDLKITLAREAVTNDWSVRQMEKAAQAASQPVVEKPAAPAKRLSQELRQMEDKLRETLGVRAAISGTRKKGKITLTYYTPEELDRLYDLLDQLKQ